VNSGPLKAVAVLCLSTLAVARNRDAPPETKSRFVTGQTYCAGSTPCILTAHNNNNRDGANPNESVFRASTLNAGNHPVPKWLASTDGIIYTQPLYIHQFTINGAAKNVVFVATENNSVYGFDSDSTSPTGTVLAQTNLNNASDLGPGFTEISVPYTDLPRACGLLVPETGISGTPVIDISVTPPVIYLVSKHEDIDSQGEKTFRHKLHGLYADTLQEIPGSPVIIDEAFEDKYAPGMDPLHHLQRPGLALIPSGNSSKIWASWGSNCDSQPYYGFAIEFTYNYSAASHSPGFSGHYTVVNASPSCTSQPCQTGIWMSGAAPAVDSSGNVYLATGNGAYKQQGSGEYSNSIFRLNDNGLQDFYSPPDFAGLNTGHTTIACTNPQPQSCPAPCALDTTGQYCQATLEHGDWDLGAGGVMLLAPSFKLANPEILAAGKQGMVYVAYANNLGHVDAQWQSSREYACSTSDSPVSGAIAQCFQGLMLTVLPTHDDSGLRGSAAFLAGNAGSPINFLYTAGVSDTLKAFAFLNQNGVGRFDPNPIIAASPHTFDDGASPEVTWNNAGDLNDGIVWLLDAEGPPPGHKAKAETLYAYRAVPFGYTSSTSSTLGPELWNSSAYNTASPGNPGSGKFEVPTIIDGKIFLAGGAQGYVAGSDNCPAPSATVQPTACGGLAMFK